MMSENLYVKILSQLAKLNYKGRISPFGINEPLLDRRIVKFVRMAKEACPGAYVSLVTNGDYLTAEVLRGLGNANIDALGISIYDSIGYERHRSTEYPSWVTIMDMRHTPKENRAGNLEGLGTPDMPCLRPSEIMFVQADGKVRLCCADFHGIAAGLGNVKDLALLDIWYSPVFEWYRNKLKSHRFGSNPCQVCNHDGSTAGREYPATLRQLPVTNYGTRRITNYEESSAEAGDS